MKGGFYRLDDGQTYAHINWGHKQGPAPCRAPRLETDAPKIGDGCGRVSAFLCDWRTSKRLDGTFITCDRPLCQVHAEAVGPDKHLCPQHFLEAQRRGFVTDGVTTP